MREVRPGLLRKLNGKMVVITFDIESEPSFVARKEVCEAVCLDCSPLFPKVPLSLEIPL